MRACSRCVYDDTLPNISFDSHGVCNYYKDFDKLVAEYPMEDAGWKKFQEIAAQVKKTGRCKKFDCVIGVSKGCDSSYLVYLTKEKLGLHPLAFKFRYHVVPNTFYIKNFKYEARKKREQT